MRLLILASWYPSASSPVEGVFIQEQARELATRHNIVVLVPQAGGSCAITVEQDSVGGFPVYTQGGTQAREARERFSRLRPMFKRLGLADLINAPAYKAYSKAAHTALDFIARAWGTPELMHAHVTLPGGWAAACWGKARTVPVVITEHASIAMHIDTPLKQRLARVALRGCAQVVAVSPHLAEAIRAFAPSTPLTVVGNMVRMDLFTASTTPRQPGPLRVLAVSMLAERKGLRYLLDAAAKLLDAGEDGFTITIGGDGPERITLEEQAQRLGLGAHLSFLGRLNREQVAEQMRACDLFCLPSLHESFGIVLAEALACGKPVLSTTNGGALFVVEPGQGLLVQPANASALAEGLQRFLGGEVKVDPAALHARVAERFSPEAIGDQLDAVYARALSAGPVR